MAFEDLAVAVLQQIGAVAVQHARAAAVHRGGVAVLDVEAVAAGLDAVDRDVAVVEERMEQADGVGAAADAGDERVGQAAFGLEDLLARLAADHRLEVAHHLRIGMRAGGGADQVVGVSTLVTQSRSASFMASFSVRVAGGDRRHLGAEQLHAEDVGLLPLDVGRAHVDDAGEAEARRDGRRGDAVLAGAGLGDDARLAHAAGEQDLAEAVVDLVAAGVVELVALEVDLGAAEMLGQPLGEIERARPAGIVGVEVVELGLEGGSALAAS